MLRDNQYTPFPFRRLTLVATMLLSCHVSADTTASRTTQYSYYSAGQNGAGQLASMDGPRTDVADLTSYEYTPEGFLWRVTNALGHVQEITAHDAIGRLLTILDANGVSTNLTYTARGWLKSITVGNGNLQAITRYDYDHLGQVSRVTLPDGVILNYRYDSAHRLTQISDTQGNAIHYTLDSAGNIIRQTSTDNGGLVFQAINRVFDELNRLRDVTTATAGGQVTQAQDYDGGDRLTNSQQGSKPAEENLYDALDRVTRINHPDGGSSAYTYDSENRLLTVEDQRGLITHYSHDALGNLLEINSPDTGITWHDFDAAGNRVYTRDARGIESFASYDALNRLVAITYPGNPSLNVTYSYDDTSSGNYGIGRLTGITDATGSTYLGYDALGRLETRTVYLNGIPYEWYYQYDAAGKPVAMTYPSGQTLHYAYDSLGQLSGITLDDGITTVPLVQQAQYLPFGPLAQYQQGNGMTTQRSFDEGYRIQGIQVSGAVPLMAREYTFESAGNISEIADLSEPDQDRQFSYDDVSRLTAAEQPFSSIQYSYDPVGNRLSHTENGQRVDYNYALISNQLLDAASQAYQYDEAGHLISDGQHDFRYDESGRLVEVLQGGVSLASYTHNAQGQRVSKTTSGGTTYFHYDTQGQLVAESDAAGNILREYYYLQGAVIAMRDIQSESGPSSQAEVILDNSSAAFSASGNWVSSSAVAGYEGQDYRYLAPVAALTTTLGEPEDEADSAAVLTGDWKPSTVVSGYYGAGYHYLLPQQGPGELGSPMDNGNAAFQATGNWKTSSSVSGFYGTHYLAHAAGDGAAQANWQLIVPTDGDYDVHVTWTAHGNRATNARYTVSHAAGQSEVRLNQQQNGGQWNLLGSYTFAAGQVYPLILDNDANGYVIADAVTVLPRGTPPETSPIPGSNQAQWTLDVPTDGQYDVYATWTAHPNRSTQANYRISHDDGITTVTVDQQQQGGQWNKLATATFMAGQAATVTLTEATDGVVIADAVTLVPAGTYPESAANAGDDRASWSLTDITPGTYQVYARWTAHANRSPDAVYSVHHAAGESQQVVNQTTAGGEWYLLGSYPLDTTSSIELAGDSSGHVIADAIRLVAEAVTPAETPAESTYYYVHNDHLGTPQIITDDSQNIVWQADYTPFGQATLQVEQISNNIRFPGQYYDTETGLHYNYFRDYDPSMGRYIQSDPVGLTGGLNTYGYVLNNPIIRIDLYGLETLTIGISVKVPGWIVRQILPNFLGEGAAAGVALSVPDKCGLGEYDIGFYGALDFVGADNTPNINLGGRLTFDAGLHSGSVKDLAGVDAEMSIHQAHGGVTVSLDDSGVTGVEVNIGPGMNIGGNASMTSAYSIRNGLRTPH